jgi:tRNA(Ile)-lysidine synthase TilS/MesJ
MDALDGHFLKPLLGVDKEHLQRYLQCRGLAWREDASNQSRKYKRNAVRLDLLPLMAELAGGTDALASRLEQLSAQSGDVRELLQMEVSSRWPLLCALLSSHMLYAARPMLCTAYRMLNTMCHI